MSHCVSMPRHRLALVAGLVFAAGCASHASEHHYFHEHEQDHAAAWSYEGETGPEHWGELDAAYATAKSGTQQSPIDIRDATAADLPAIRFDYRPSAIDAVYNGHTIEDKGDGKSSITVGGAEYVLQQFHFHAPSEHTIAGAHSDMEMHLVHKGDGGAVAVVAVMIRAGAENRAFAPLWNELPTAAAGTVRSTLTVHPAELLPPEPRAYYRYTGSFTTPPCTEGVLWLVLQQPIELSPAQIARFKAIVRRNNRPVQPRNGRVIERAR
jgi:carbonic anhydrase